jgi:L-lactate dehydrogenase
MKVTIIGGAGRVGSNAAYALQLGGIVREMVIVDVMEEVAKGEALDLMHGSSGTSSQVIRAGGYDAADYSDIIMITAGLRRKPDESRLDLINRNVGLFRDILGNLKKVKAKDDTLIFVVANPVDILTYIAVKESGYPSDRVFALGTVLDMVRFRSFLADHFQVSPLDVKAVILGEHGDSMVPIWSSATIGGVPLKSYPNSDDATLAQIFDNTKKSGAQVIKMKGGAGWAVGVAIKMVTEAIALDTKSVLPISSLIDGPLGISDVCLSLPTRVGRCGVEQVYEPAVSDQEKDGIRNSEKVLKDYIKQVM